MDERVIIEPGTDERFLIPVGEGPSASSVALLEPWACVEASYSHRERDRLLPAGRLLVVASPGHPVQGLVPLVAGAAPGRGDRRRGGGHAARCAPGGCRAGGTVRSRSSTTSARCPSKPSTTWCTSARMPTRSNGCRRCWRPAGSSTSCSAVGVSGDPWRSTWGESHYDLTRWVGTTGAAAVDGYRMAPADGELRAGDRVAVIGAAGPMGLMHAVRTVTSGLAEVELTAVDIDVHRLDHLATIVTPLAAERGVRAVFVDSRTSHTPAGVQLHRGHGPRSATRGAGGRPGRSGRSDQHLRRVRIRDPRGARPGCPHRQGMLPPGHERLGDPRHEGGPGKARAR